MLLAQFDCSFCFIVLSGEDLTSFRRASERVFSVLHKFTNLAERLVLDEVFCDITDLVHAILRGDRSMLAKRLPADPAMWAGRNFGYCTLA